MGFSCARISSVAEDGIRTPRDGGDLSGNRGIGALPYPWTPQEELRKTAKEEKTRRYRGGVRDEERWIGLPLYKGGERRPVPYGRFYIETTLYKLFEEFNWMYDPPLDLVTNIITVPSFWPGTF